MPPSVCPRAGLPRVSLLAAGLLIACQAQAQSSDNAATDHAARADAKTLDTIVVTGEKSDRSLQDTSSSVAVTTSTRIEQENLQDLYEVFNRTGNVGQTYGNAGFTIRGIQDKEGGGFAPLATIYLDGAALPDMIIDSGPSSLWDIAQVEILRGPQSTLQGENALAGAIILRSEDPTMQWSGRARASFSDPSDTTLSFAGGGPLLRDELAIRVSYEDRNFNGTIWNPTRGERLDAVDSQLVRVKLLWTPKAMPGLEARLGLTWLDRTGPHKFGQSRLDVPDPYGHRINLSDFPNQGDTRVDAATLQLDYTLSDAWSLHAVTAWNQTSDARKLDSDMTAQPLSWRAGLDHYTVFSQEFRVNYQGERLNGLLGGYFSKRDNEGWFAQLVNVKTPEATIAAVLQANGVDVATAGQVARLYVGALPLIPVDYRGVGSSRSENNALFGDGEFRLGERFQLLGGFRYDRQSYGYSNDLDTRFVGVLPDPAAFGPSLAPVIAGINQAVLGIVTQAGSDIPMNTRRFTTFLPKLGLRYAFTDDVSASFVAQRGYRSGGSSVNNARSLSVAYDPEYTWNYEAALRSQWLGGRLTLNANAYYIDWRDKQVVANFGLNQYDYHTVNAGKAHLYGFELEATHRVNAGFDWYASLGYSRTRYDEFKAVLGAQINDYAGYEFAFAPRWTLGAGANWRFGQGWLANLNANFRDKINLDVGAGDRRLPSRTLVNAKFGYDTLDWGAWIFANNLLDEQYAQYIEPNRSNGILGAPRVVGVGFEYRW